MRQLTVSWRWVQAHQNRDTDKELLFLKIYLLKIAELESMSELRHSRWENYIKNELYSLFPER